MENSLIFFIYHDFSKTYETDHAFDNAHCLYAIPDKTRSRHLAVATYSTYREPQEIGSCCTTSLRQNVSFDGQGSHCCRREPLINDVVKQIRTRQCCDTVYKLLSARRR